MPYNFRADVVCLLAERCDTKSIVKLGGFRSHLQAFYVSSHTGELWYHETACLWMTIYIYIYILRVCVWMFIAPKITKIWMFILKSFLKIILLKITSKISTLFNRLPHQSNVMFMIEFQWEISKVNHVPKFKYFMYFWLVLVNVWLCVVSTK